MAINALDEDAIMYAKYSKELERAKGYRRKVVEKQIAFYWKKLQAKK